jgi:hypothetical protein
MAIKLYHGLGVPAYTPDSWKGSWDDIAAALTKPLSVTVENNPLMGGKSPLEAIARAETSATNPYSVALLRLVSAPLLGNQTISETLTVVLACLEDSSAADISLKVHAWVTEGNSSTIRGTLVTNSIDATEWSNGLVRGESYAVAISNVNALDGDRLIIELGYSAANSSTTSHTGTIYYGSNDTYPDLVDGDTLTPAYRNPYIEISNDITFNIAAIRASQVVAEILEDASLSNKIRASQVVLEIAEVNVPPTRFSQVVIEVLTLATPVTTIIWNPLAVRCQATYYANLYDTSGHLLAVFDDFKPLTIEHKINSFSNCTFSIDGLDSRINLFGLDYILEIWRDIGDVKYIEFEGLHRSDQLQYTEGGHWIYTSYSRSFEDFLMRRCVLYRNLAKVLNPDGVTYHGFTLKQIPADDAMKEFVDENIGPGANNHVVGDSNTRLVNGAMSGFNVQADASLGPTYFANFSYLNLYEVLQTIAEATGVDFKVRRYSGNQFEFQTFYPQLGADKSSTLIFAPEYGNMTVPSYIKSRTEEVNVVAILGKGENTRRNCLTFERASTFDSPWNRRETTHDSRNDTGQGFIDTSTEVLNNLKAKEEFTFKVMQTDASAYGHDYVLGDVCTVKFGAITKLKKITGVTINVRDGKEEIDIEFSDYPTIPPI